MTRAVPTGPAGRRAVPDGSQLPPTGTRGTPTALIGTKGRGREERRGRVSRLRGADGGGRRTLQAVSVGGQPKRPVSGTERFRPQQLPPAGTRGTPTARIGTKERGRYPANGHGITSAFAVSLRRGGAGERHGGSGCPDSGARMRGVSRAGLPPSPRRGRGVSARPPSAGPRRRARRAGAGASSRARRGARPPGRPRASRPRAWTARRPSPRGNPRRP